MKRKKAINLKETDIISASEIGQYHFCSIAWYLKKCGYQPESLLIKAGTVEHEKLGKILDNVETDSRKSKFVAIVGYFLLFLAAIFFLLEVIL
jgi:hypothetical protein